MKVDGQAFSLFFLALNHGGKYLVLLFLFQPFEFGFAYTLLTSYLSEFVPVKQISNERCEYHDSYNQCQQIPIGALSFQSKFSPILLIFQSQYLSENVMVRTTPSNFLGTNNQVEHQKLYKKTALLLVGWAFGVQLGSLEKSVLANAEKFVHFIPIFLAT